MALAKRSSRSIVVDDVAYRWVFSLDSGYGVLVVQHASGSGQRLEAQTALLDPGQQGSLTSVGVARVIRFALESGWTPTRSAPPLSLREIDRQVQLYSDRPHD